MFAGKNFLPVLFIKKTKKTFIVQYLFDADIGIPVYKN